MKELLIVLSGFLVIVSSCPDGGFQCTSGDCVPTHSVCNFKDDCPDGSDEEFCGSCDFERHACGWTDTTSSSYSWRRRTANISSVPGEDHTTGSPSGHVMHINGSAGGDMFPKATLEYLVAHQVALACQMSFWYHIFDNDSLPSSSSLKVYLIRDTHETQLLRISDGRTNRWTNATVFIGNHPPGHKLRFRFEPPFGSTKDVMLDDIRMENCGEADIPEGSDHLTCDFEKDLCSWYHDYTASLLWERSKEDLAESSGYYMVIGAEGNLNTSTARLKSIPQPANQVLCVSFWYHIFGNSIGSLKFITKRSGEQETVVWKRSSTQGNKWRFADLTFNSDKPIQFTIEVIVGGNQGSIAIDTIVVTRSTDGSCPPERECTFQGSLCGLLPQPLADFAWDRMTGTSRPANSSGPIADHTLRTQQGYYLSAQLWRHAVGSRGAMTTAVMKPTPAYGECLLFWYYMEGSGVGELSVYLQTHNSTADPAPLWTRRGDQGTHWRHARVTLLSPQTLYQVIFEAKVGDAPRRDIAIDDLTVQNDACPPAGFCDFEMDFCGWVNSPPPESGMDWDWLSGSSAGDFVPKRDHTTDSALGHFAFFGSVKSDHEAVARLESESMAPVDEACLELWHRSELWAHQMTDLTLTVFVSESAGLRPLTTIRGFSNGTWIREMVDYSASGPHQLVLQVQCPGSKEGSFSLDDVHIVRNKSCSDLTVTTTTAPPSTTTTTAAPASHMDCQFEQGLCNWVQEDADDSNWTLTKGVEVNQPWDGPEYDHTVENNQGFFLLLNGSGSKNAERAVVSVPVIKGASDMCMGFWYYMLGPSVSRLDLLVEKEASEQLLWTRRGTQSAKWVKTQVTISMNRTMQFKLAGYRNTQSRGFIAIDDITVREGVCFDRDTCGFDSGWCGFENNVNHKGRWVSRRGTQHQADHTYGTEEGSYMTYMMSDSAQPEVAELLSPLYAASERMCVRFWYWLSPGSSTDLIVSVLRSEEVGKAFWQRRGSPTDGWEVAEITVFSPLQFHVAFQTNHVPGSNSTVKLDDYSVRDGACSPTAACDFESGQCTWVNIPTEDGHNWVLASGGFQGPSVDHTIETQQGWFLLSSARHKSHSSIAQVTSEWIPAESGASCLTLWYHMDGSHSGTLRVFNRSRPSEDKLIFQSESSGSAWSRFSQSVQTSQPFQLLVEANSTNRGFIAIDDITLTAGLCQVNGSSSVFVGCSFENGTCGWQDISVGQGQWVRGRNASGNMGPPVDHTLGTPLGWYVAVEADRGEQLSPAALQSPALKQASADCILHFHYNVFGGGGDDLKVLLKEGSRITTLWWLSGNQGDSWRLSEVSVGRVVQDFTVVFEASRTFSERGHIALDDVDFLNCSLPEPQPSCPDTQFTCSNNVCVDHGRVCDFSDDCGDWSDENNCEQRGVLERCSFEQGSCFWESDEGRPGAEWTVHMGQDAWPGQGPPRDHTQNSAAGHYVIPGTHLVTGQTSEVTSRTLLSSLNCTVRFFYFSLNDTSAGLRARLRTGYSGDDDVVLWSKPSSQSYSWRRAEVTFSSSASSKIVFSYEPGNGTRGLVALDDISFSRQCALDPANSQLPDTPPVNPCQDGQFFCWQSAGDVCIEDASRCDYHADCPLGEDEAGCGPCTFESDQCQWTVSSAGPSTWQRLKASSSTVPPSDHTTGRGYYMSVMSSQGSGRSGAMLQSPTLPPPSPYCQLLFHFHISAASAGSLTVLMQQGPGSEAILWSRSHNTVSNWTPEHLPVGPQRPYKVWFSYLNGTNGDSSAVDDISFVNCEKSYQPPVLSTYDCSFEKDLCTWVQGAQDELDWLSGSGPTETLNTGPAGDHTTGQGKYLHIESSPPSEKGNKAQLKSLLLPPAGDKGYCVTFWYHMFGPTVGSLKMFLQTVDPLDKILVWQRSGNQEDEWRAARAHVTLPKVHQVILEATVGGAAGDVAIDDISFIEGPCAASDTCDFEEGSCDWQQQTNDDFDWVRQSGNISHPSTAPEGDHTTNTARGHYYYLPSLPSDRSGQRAVMVSPLYPPASRTCMQLWYHMSGKKVGTLNIYQQSEGGEETLVFSQMGNQGRLWRLAQALLEPQVHPYQIVVEGVKAGPAPDGGIALDDVVLIDVQCPPPGSCDFEMSMCRWSNQGGGADQGDWLRGRGASANTSSGPSMDHTTNSSQGYYVYVDSSVGQWGDTSLLIGDVLQPSTRGHCLTFWYHMYGEHVGTLKVSINDWSMQAAGTEEGALKWIAAENKGERWHQASVYIKHQEAFWFVFAYQQGSSNSGDVALDDITIRPHRCFTDPPSPPSDEGVTTGLIVGVTLLAGLIIFLLLFILNRKWSKKNGMETLNNDGLDQSSVFNLSGYNTEDMQHGTDTDFAFPNILYDPSSESVNSTAASSDA